MCGPCPAAARRYRETARQRCAEVTQVGGNVQAADRALAGIPAYPGLSRAWEALSPSGQRALMNAITARICSSSSYLANAGM